MRLRKTSLGEVLGPCLLASSLMATGQSTAKPIVVRRPPAASTAAAPTSTLPASAGPPAAQRPTQPIVVRRSTEQPLAAAAGTPLTPSTTSIAGNAELHTLLDQHAIGDLLHRQSEDWNRGDLDAFAQGYKHSPDILFLSGNTVRRGYDGMLARYKESYPTRERMGRLTFSEIEVQPLSPQFATATGRFHLERSAGGGGNADGSFLLVLENTREGWKIVRDDTTSLPVRPK